MYEECMKEILTRSNMQCMQDLQVFNRPDNNTTVENREHEVKEAIKLNMKTLEEIVNIIQVIPEKVLNRKITVSNDDDGQRTIESLREESIKLSAALQSSRFAPLNIKKTVKPIVVSRNIIETVIFHNLEQGQDVTVNFKLKNQVLVSNHENLLSRILRIDKVPIQRNLNSKIAEPLSIASFKKLFNNTEQTLRSQLDEWTEVFVAFGDYIDDSRVNTGRFQPLIKDILTKLVEYYGQGGKRVSPFISFENITYSPIQPIQQILELITYGPLLIDGLLS